MISGLVTRLLADGTISGLVGDKIFPVVAEQEVKRPYVTIRRTGTSPTIVKNEQSGKDEVNVNIAAYAESYKECVQILAAIRASIDNYRGTSAGINFLNVWYQVSEDLFDNKDDTYIVVDTYAARVKR